MGQSESSLMVQFLLQTSWCLPLYGLLGAIATLPWALGFTRRTGPRLAAYINILVTAIAFLHGTIVLRSVWGHSPYELTIPWLQAANLELSLDFKFSTVTLLATEFVTGLSLLAQVFALGYMEKDWSMARFFALLGFFEAAMAGVALSNSLFISYALLEMLTLSTYLLVGFWYAQPLVVNAARDALLTKRVGDLFLLMGVVALSFLAGSLNFSNLAAWSSTATLSPLVATLLGLALIAGPTGKCAQFPLHLWLDEAMEGPSPASIMRNAVVVTTGAYILIELQPVLALSPIASTVLVVLGTITAVGESMVAIAQVDIKRTLSHSTSAYLGLVFIAVGLQSTNAALLLLLTHGAAKALMFMSIGSVTLTTNTQDVTEMGGLGGRMPATAAAFAIGSVGLVAVLPFGCFWGMVEWVRIIQILQPAMVAVLALVNGLTAFNLVRVYGLVFAGSMQPKTRRSPEVAWPMAVPTVILIVLNLLLPLLLLRANILSDVRLVPWGTVGIVVATGTLGSGVAAAIYLFGSIPKPIRLPSQSLQDLLAYDFYIDRLYRGTIVALVGWISRSTAWLDRYVVDGAVNLVGLAMLFGGESLKYSSFGKSQLYLLTILLGLGLLGILMTWSLSRGGM